MSREFDDIDPDTMAAAARRASAGQVATGDPVRGLIDAACEAIRSTGHDRTRTGTPGELYERVGSAVDLLGKTQQLLDRLAREAAVMDQAGLFSDDQDEPSAHLYTARGDLAAAASRVEHALHTANDAHSALSHLGHADPS